MQAPNSRILEFNNKNVKSYQKAINWTFFKKAIWRLIQSESNIFVKY